MTDYVIYHKAEKMGYPVIDVENLAVYTRKSAANAIGCRAWLIAGEGKPRTYRLRATFLIKDIEPSDRRDFKHRVTGTDGQLLDPMPLLGSEPWFSAFVEEQGRFAFGFNRIDNKSAEEGFRAIMLANTLR
jgi:hypothetical protein